MREARSQIEVGCSRQLLHTATLFVSALWRKDVCALWRKAKYRWSAAAASAGKWLTLQTCKLAKKLKSQKAKKPKYKTEIQNRIQME